ncbi:MAG: hypothetical protein IPL16_12845 [Ignavibacteria bacterium]|nr:hypothetical protein [Ignavibacteria bacterium]
MSSLQKKFIDTFDLGSDKEKQKAIFETDGPTLIIAGPEQVKLTHWFYELFI